MGWAKPSEQLHPGGMSFLSCLHKESPHTMDMREFLYLTQTQFQLPHRDALGQVFCNFSSAHK